MEHNLMVFIGSLMNIFVLDRQVRVFFDKRRTSFPVYAASFLFYFVLMNAFSLFGFHPRTSMLIWFTSRIVVSLNYEGSWKKRIIASISFTAIAGILDLTVMRLFGLYFASFFDGDVHHNFLSMTVGILITFIAALALQRFTHLKKDVISSPAVLAFLFIIPLSSIVLAFFLAVTTNPTLFGAVLTSAIIFGINVIVFYLHDRLSASHARNLEAAMYAQEKDYYLAQCQMMQESVKQVRSIRHDMRSHLAAIQGLSVACKAQPVTEYLGTLLGSMEETELYSSTGNTAFDSIINYKLKNARQQRIKPDVRLSIPPALNVELSDITVILGNLLDNALDAVAKVDDKQIVLDIAYSQETLYIMVKNTFDGNVAYAQDKGEKRIAAGIASRKDGREHGYGLGNIRRCIDKYGGHMDITHDAGWFTVTLMLLCG